MVRLAMSRKTRARRVLCKVLPATLLGASIASAVAGSAVAQVAQSVTPFDRDLSSDVASRPHPEYDPLGVPVRSFILYPDLDISFTADDNIYGLPQKTGDVYGVIRPQADLASQWSRNSLAFHAGAEFDEYINHSQESADQYNGSVTGRIDIDRDSAINLLASDALITEPRTAPDSLSVFSKPVQYTEGQLSGSAFRNFNRFRVTGSVSYANFQYQDVRLSDGTLFNESIRNESEITETVRGDYAVSPKLALFVSVSPNQANFEHLDTINYNSDGLSVLGGVNFQITHLVTGEVGIGYYTQHYDSSVFGDVSGIDYNALIKYFPTQLLTLTLKAQHAVAPSGIPQSPSTLADEGTLTADYELLRNVIISANGNFAEYNYPGLSRRDDRYGAGLKVRYLINRVVTLRLNMSHLNQTSAGVGRGYNFDDNQITFGVSLKR